MIARSRSLPLMVSAVADVGAIGRRETRGGIGQPGAWRTRPPAPTTAEATNAAATRRDDAPPQRSAWQRRGRCRAGRWREARALLQHEQRGGDVGHATPAILGETTLQKRANRRRHLRRERRPVRVDLQHVRERVADVLAVERTRCRSASRTARTRTPRCRCACPPRVPSLAPGPCRPRCRGSRPTPVIIAGEVIVGDVGDARRHRRVSRLPDAPSRARSPAPSPCRPARTLMFAGFRSRWMMPCSCAASSASAICFAIGSASSSGIGPLRDPLGERRRPRPVPSRARARRPTLSRP